MVSFFHRHKGTPATGSATESNERKTPFNTASSSSSCPPKEEPTERVPFGDEEEEYELAAETESFVHESSSPCINSITVICSPCHCQAVRRAQTLEGLGNLEPKIPHMPHFEEVFDKAASMSQTALHVGKDKANEISEMLKEQGQKALAHPVTYSTHITRKLGEAAHQLHESIETWLLNKIEAVVAAKLALVPKSLKRALADPRMPGFLAKAQDRVIDACWEDIQEELMWDLAMMMDTKEKQHIGEKPREVSRLRAWLRYHLDPYDRSFWSRLSDPCWISFRLLSLIPIYACGPLVYFIMFLTFDKEDEYQLTNFILYFKGMHFTTLGVAKCLVGFFLYYNCTTHMDNDTRAIVNTCEEKGPGRSVLENTISFTGSMLCVLLSWTSFFLLRFAKEKGARHLKHVHSFKHHKPGGRLRPLAIWDICTFFVCAVGVLLAGRWHDQGEGWRLKSDLFWAQILYGLLSLPFLPFILPGLRQVLTHARATGYDRKGHCRPLHYIHKEKGRKNREPEDKKVLQEGEAHGMIVSILEYLRSHLKEYPTLHSWVGQLLPPGHEKVDLYHDGEDLEADKVLRALEEIEMDPEMAEAAEAIGAAAEAEEEASKRLENLSHRKHVMHKTAKGIKHTAEALGHLHHTLKAHLPEEEVSSIVNGVMGHVSKRIHHHHSQKEEGAVSLDRGGTTASVREEVPREGADPWIHQ